MWVNDRMKGWDKAPVRYAGTLDSLTEFGERVKAAEAIVPDAPMTERVVQNVDAHLGAVR